MGERHRGSNPVGIPKALQFDEFNECLPKLGARVTRYKPSQVGDGPQARDSVPSDRLALNCLRVEYFDLLALIELNPTDDIFRGAAGSTLGTTKIKAHALGLPAAIDIVTTKDLGGLEIELCEVVFPAAAEWMSIQFDMEQPNHLGEHHFRSELPARLAHFRADFVTCLKQWILVLDSQLRKLVPTMFRFVGNEPKSFVELRLWCEERWYVYDEQPGHRDQFRREFVEYVEQLGAPLQASGFQIEGDEPLRSIRGRGKQLCMKLAIQHREIPPTWHDAVWLLTKPVRTMSDLALWLLDRQQRLDEFWPASIQHVVVANFRQKVLAALVHLVKVWQPAHAPSDRSELLQQLLDVRRLCRSWHGESDEPARRTVCYAITEAHRFLADLRLANRPQWPIEPTTLLEAEQQLERMIAWLGTMTSETPPPAPNAGGGAAEGNSEPSKPVDWKAGTLAGGDDAGTDVAKQVKPAKGKKAGHLKNSEELFKTALRKHHGYETGGSVSTYDYATTYRIAELVDERISASTAGRQFNEHFGREHKNGKGKTGGIGAYRHSCIAKTIGTKLMVLFGDALKAFGTLGDSQDGISVDDDHEDDSDDEGNSPKSRGGQRRKVGYKF